MAIAAGKGPKAQKIGLEEQAPAQVRRISDSASSQICVWELPQRDAGRVGETVPHASRASLPPVPVPNPLGRGAGGRRSKLYDAPRLGRAS